MSIHENKSILVVEKVNAGYGSLQVLFDITFSVPERSIVAVVGRNGAGKTTLLKTIAGFIKPYSGKILFQGLDITNLPPYKRAKMGVMYLRQDRMIFDNLTVKECLELVTYSFKKSEDDITKVLEIFPRLKERINSKSRHLSGGERQMLLLAQAFLSGASLLMIDEPTEGLAPRVVKEVYDILEFFKREEKRTLIIVEQKIDIVKELADMVLVLAEGKVIDLINNKEDIKRLDLTKYKI
ncbi:MAG: ABC transporter ATP-binding protein [Ignisphaera sp.]